MESNPGSAGITFQILGKRLLLFVHSRIDNGDLTERGLAKILGISQPQMHNVLKGVRKLQPTLADRILRSFGISVIDLVESKELFEEIIARGAIDARTEPAYFRVGDHVAPRRIEVEAVPRKKPGRERAAPQDEQEQAS